MNEEITEATVLLYGDDGKLAELPLVEALRIAKARKLDLVEEWERPPARRRGTVVCKLLHIRQPVAWEGENDGTIEVEPSPDPALWFHIDHCSGAHYFVGNPHTFPGRIHAWCPTKRVHFFVSKSEIKDCSKEAGYFVKGFLSGQEPDAPVDDEGELLPYGDADHQAWVRATRLFHETGDWNTRFRICDVCGARLLPSNNEDTCRYSHRR